ncbi:MAG TPA: sulfite exporter TauE/SafE family protein [Armatimonadota bacterium]
MGAIAGVASGLFGIGGGLIMLPIFTILMKMDPHRAAATSLAIVVLPVALPGVITFHRAGQIDWRIVLWVAIGFAVCNVVGSRMNLSLNPQILKRVFAIFLILAAINLFAQSMKKPATAKAPAAAESGKTI